MPKHISYSQLKNWAKCPFYHKLSNIDKVDGAFSGNIYTAFGSALHETIENHLENTISDQELKEHFRASFLNERNRLSDEIEDKHYDQFLLQGENLVKKYKKHLDSYFGGNYEIVKCEEEIYENVTEYEGNSFKFKGFIDLVVKKGETYHILDWKSCTWGWDAKKKADKMIVYQLIFYKHYYALKYGIDPKKIECHFGLLKRTAKRNEVEIFKVTSGKRRTENAMKLLVHALHNIDNGVYLKNRTSCRMCEFKGTKHCP
jgi:predicted RecB family nuclease